VTEIRIDLFVVEYCDYFVSLHPIKALSTSCLVIRMFVESARIVYCGTPESEQRKCDKNDEIGQDLYICHHT